MPLFSELNALFIHIPRTGGTNLENILKLDCTWPKTSLNRLFGPYKKNDQNFILQHLTADEILKHQFLSPGQFAQLYKFTIVRNPYYRCVSLYHYWRKMQQLPSFEDFARRLAELNIDTASLNTQFTRHIAPLYRYIFDDAGTQLVDFVARFENYSSDVPLILSKLNVSWDRPVFDQARQIQRTDHYLDIYTPTTRELVRRVYQQDFETFGYDRVQRKIVFIGGMHGSGTSLLFKVLRDHPEISGFSNTKSPQDEGQHLQSVYLPAYKFSGGLFGLDPEAYLDKNSPLATVDNGEKLFLEWSRYWDLNRPVLLEKSPPNLVRTRFLQELFPEARFIILKRHPLAVIQSQKRKLAPKAPYRRLLANWLAGYKRFMADKNHLRYVLEITYEDLINNTEATLKRIFQFIGVEIIPIQQEIKPDLNETYFMRWEGNQTEEADQLIEEFEEKINSLGYSFKVGPNDYKIILYKYHPQAVNVQPAPRRRNISGLETTLLAEDIGLQQATSNGWELCCPYAFTAVWNGGPSPDDIKISLPGFVYSNLGHGILSFDTGYLVEILGSHKLWVRGPVNHPKDNLTPLERLLNVSAQPTGLQIHWKFTQPDQVVNFEKGEPFAMLMPYPAGYLESFTGQIKLVDEAETPAMATPPQPVNKLRERLS